MISYFDDKELAKINRIFSGLIAGGFASIITQPLDVIKTMILINPFHSKVIETGYNINSFKESILSIYKYKNRGFANFFQGAKIAFLRQSFGFAIYSFMIDELNKKMQARKRNYFLLSLSAACSKIIAVTFTTPLIVIKTRFELISNNEYKSIKEAFIKIRRDESLKTLLKGSSSVLSREIVYSLIQYGLYQFFLDQFGKKENLKIFISSYASSLIALIFSHPFEVVRNRIMIQQKFLVNDKVYTGLYYGIKKIIKLDGLKGFFKGILPRIIRKPINSALAWSLYEFNRKAFKC